MRNAAVARYRSRLAIRAELTADPLVADTRRRVSVR